MSGISKWADREVQLACQRENPDYQEGEFDYGCACYQSALKAFESVIRYMKEQGIGYGSVNHPVDRDPVCGYTGVIDDICPRCGRKEGEPVSLAFLKELRKKYPNVPVYTDEEIMAGGIEHDWRRTQECGCSSK